MAGAARHRLRAALQSHLIRPEYFSHDFQLFPTWPRFDVELMMSLFWFSMVVLLIPKMLGLIRALLSKRASAAAAAASSASRASVLLEIVLSALYAPMLMLIQMPPRFEVFMGRDSGWKPQRREGGSTAGARPGTFTAAHAAELASPP